MRHRVGVPGQIEREKRRPLRCKVIGVSLHGVCVWAPATALPDIFALSSVGTRHVCEVLWRKDDMVGARFVGLDRLLEDRPTKFKESWEAMVRGE
jgi:hypothetical protein